ncbi:hypothetical protein HanRHA438_Chr11g0530561 [Helianthus annuus]|nr:hypothetical protein HanRHA438_Chr11g0530561 [Helianthus annuus]
MGLGREIYNPKQPKLKKKKKKKIVSWDRRKACLGVLRLKNASKVDDYAVF